MNSGGTNADLASGGLSRFPVKAQVFDLQSSEFCLSDLECDIAGGERRAHGCNAGDDSERAGAKSEWAEVHSLMVHGIQE
jgi:hypothetical protein